MPASAEICDGIACKGEGGGPPRAAGFCLNVAGIWGMGGAAISCRSVLKDRERDSMRVEMFVMWCV
jgi:hypothetical protein